MLHEQIHPNGLNQIEARRSMRERIQFTTPDRRLRIKQFIVPDAEAICNLVTPHHEELLLFGTHTGLNCGTVPEFRKWIQNPDEPDELRFGAWDTSNNLVGAIALANAWDDTSAHLSYYVGSQYQGNRYGTDGVSAVIEYAFANLGYNEIYMEVAKTNNASLGLVNHLACSMEPSYNERTNYFVVRKPQ